MLVECPHCSTRVLPMAGRICPACRKNVDAEPDLGPTAEELTQAAAYSAAAEEISRGVEPGRVAQNLADRGVNSDTALNMVNELNRAKAQGILAVAKRNIAMGAMTCVVGIVITAWTYQTAINAGGGRYVLAWGAILFGAIQFLRGLFQLVVR